jgi:hypothetical protein
MEAAAPMEPAARATAILTVYLIADAEYHSEVFLEALIVGAIALRAPGRVWSRFQTEGW